MSNEEKAIIWDEGYCEAEHFERNGGDIPPVNPYRLNP